MRPDRLALFLFLPLVGTLPASGQEASLPEIAGVRVGIAGRYKPGLWTPVQVGLRGGGQPWSGQVSVVAPDGDGVPCRFSTPDDQPCRVEPGQMQTVVLHARIGRTEPELSVELRQGETTVAERAFKAGASQGANPFLPGLRSTEGLIVVVGPETFAAEETLAGLRQIAGGRTVAVRVDDVGQLPTQWFGYEGVDVVVLATSEPGLYAPLRPDSPQVAALDEWVRMGGKLLLCAGRRSEGLLGAVGPLARFAPGKLVRMIPLRQSGAIEGYCGSSVPLPRDGIGLRLDLRVPQWADVQGTVEAREGNLALIVRRAWGFGTIVATGFDLDTPPLSTWLDRGLLIGKLLDVAETLPDSARDTAAVLHYGFDDMAGQLRSALDQFREVPLVPFWLVVALVAGYLALVGPADYFLLRRFSRRMALTWITFPLLVLAFCLGTYLLACRLKGDRIRVNQVDLVDVDVASGRVRGSSWASLFSPRVDRYNLAFQAQDPGGAPAAGAGMLTAWLGLPGEAFGAMAPKTATPTVWKRAYDCAPGLDRLAGVPLQVWSTKSFHGRWTLTTKSKLEARLALQDRIPVGSISNTLGFPLTECLLFCGRWAYNLGEVAPGESAQVGTMTQRRDVTALLTGRRLLFEEGVQRTTPYDRGSIDLVYIVRAMMFFEAAGGFRYTGLVHRHQGFVDSSDLLKTDHAILVAIGPTDDPQSPHHGSRLVRDGQPLLDPQGRHATIYRFVIPVRETGARD